MGRRTLTLVIACSALACGAGTARAADPGSYDVVRATGSGATANGNAPARRAFRARAGRFALLSVDPATGTPRAIGRLNGFLTAPSAAPPAQIALGYVRARPELFRLDAGDLASLELVRRYSAAGIEQLRWAQTYEGVRAVDTSLTANLTDDGRLINLVGAPRPDLSVPSVVPAVSAADAYATAARTLGGGPSPRYARASGPERETRFANGDTAGLVIYEGHGGPRLGWRLLVRVDDLHVYDAIADATTGALVRHQNLVADADATVYRNYPNATHGGSAETVSLDAYLDPLATTLNGPTAHTFSDTQDAVQVPGDDVPTNGEIGPSGGGDWTYPLTTVPPSCAPPLCLWNPSSAGSWNTNRKADAVQLHWSVGTFHDHLEQAAGIEFDEAAGNFEGDDRVLAQNMDGAAIVGGGLPDSLHVNNANMTTYPDGTSPHMQMYLTRAGSIGRSTAFDASVVFHEYTHGLVGRTVVDADGFQAIGGAQGGAINEGTADWYAMDYLVANLLETDGPDPDVRAGVYSFGALRTEPTDCLVTSPAQGCPGTQTAGPGGYTYGDFGKVFPGPEVHADGEIFAQTMWQLRTELVAKHGAVTGVEHARELYTNGMRLSPANPSFLDLRNGILQANTAGGLGDADVIWDVFAERGMGYFASTRDTGDTAPVESFALPPAPEDPTGTVSGVVTDAATGDPAEGVTVAFAGHDSGVGPELSAVTDETGAYAIEDVPVGTYPLLRVRGGGYEEKEAANVAVAAGANTVDFQIRRNLASAAGGATIYQFTGADNAPFGCGPAGLIDDSPGVVWGSSAPGNPGDPGAKEIVVRLPVESQVGTIEIDPGAGCGDDDTASLGAYEIRVSSDGVFYTKVAEGAFTPADNHRFNSVALGAALTDVEFVKLVAKGPQSGVGSGASFMDVAEIRVFAGLPPAPEVTTQSATGVGESVATLNGLVDPNGTATTYQFEYGPTTAYGSVAPAAPENAGSGPGAVPAQASVAGLHGGTTYHYRLVAFRGAVRFEGDDATFTTTPDTTRPTLGLSLPGQKLRAVRTSGLKVKVTASEAGTAKLTLTISRGTAKRLRLGKLRTIGSLTKPVAAGSTTLVAKLNARTRKALRGKRSVTFTLRAVLTDTAHLADTETRTVTIRR